MQQKESKKIIETTLKQAQKAFILDEVPVGAVIFNSQSGQILTTSHNQTEHQNNPTSHAEMIAIQRACKKLGCKFLNGYSMFVSLEPCTMCAAAISLARLDAVYYGACDPKTGGIRQGAKVFHRPQTHYKPKHRYINHKDCGAILTHFFQLKRQKTKK